METICKFLKNGIDQPYAIAVLLLSIFLKEMKFVYRKQTWMLMWFNLFFYGYDEIMQQLQLEEEKIHFGL